MQECKNARMQECKKARMWEYETVRMRECENARMRACTNARMQECKNARMQECKNARMQECKNVRMQEGKKARKEWLSHKRSDDTARKPYVPYIELLYRWESDGTVQTSSVQQGKRRYRTYIHCTAGKATASPRRITRVRRVNVQSIQQWHSREDIGSTQAKDR